MKFSPVAFVASCLVLSVVSLGVAADQPVASTVSAPSSVASSRTNLLRPTPDAKSWTFEQIEDATGSIRSDGDALELEVTKVDGTDWHLQAYQLGLDLKEGQSYVVTLKVRASAKRVIQLYAGINEEDYHSVGLDEPVDLTPEWKELRYTFKAEGVAPKNNRIGFLLGQETGKVWVKDVVLAAN